MAVIVAGRVSPHGVIVPMDYSCSMIKRTFFFKTNKAGLVLCAALLGTLTGCIGYVDGPRARVYAPPRVVVVQDDYVYYPEYEIYYSSRRHQYFWPEGGAWVARPAPREVEVNVLFASPSVRMNFHDSPANHHTEIVRQYPRKPAPHGQNEKPGNDRRDDNGNNRGR